jgi:Tfp pilus assembly protein PilV
MKRNLLIFALVIFVGYLAALSLEMSYNYSTNSAYHEMLVQKKIEETRQAFIWFCYHPNGV